MLIKEENYAKKNIIEHEKSYGTALEEIKSGKKRSHWMWYIFPQIAGLGYSEISIYYAINSIDEAKTYMENEVLKGHMMEICQELLVLETCDASSIFGWPDDMKVQSCMTLFGISNPEYEIFQKVLDKFYGGERDKKTLEILGIEN